MNFNKGNSFIDRIIVSYEGYWLREKTNGRGIDRKRVKWSTCLAKFKEVCNSVETSRWAQKCAYSLIAYNAKFPQDYSNYHKMVSMCYTKL